jgi:hypothetical protein
VQGVLLRHSVSTGKFRFTGKLKKVAFKMNAQAFQTELEAIDVSNSFDTVPAELIRLAQVAEQNGRQSSSMKDGITAKIFEAFQNAAKADISPLSLHISTCEEHGFAHDRPVEVVDCITGQVTETVSRIKSDIKQPATFKSIATACKVVDREGIDLAQFVDSYEGENGTLKTGVSKLRKAYKDIRDAQKDLIADEAKRLKKKYSDEDIARLAELLAQ